MNLKEKEMHLKYSNWDCIEIDHRVYSRNKIDRLHWSQKRKLKQQYQLLVKNQMKLNKIIPAEDKCKIVIECHVTRMMDMDNVWGGLKQFLDSLTAEKFIYDDSPTWLDIEQVKQIKAKKPKIIVRRKYGI